MKATSTHQVDPQAIENELDAVWAQLYGEQRTGSLTRAAMSNLLVFCGDEQQALNATERIATLVEHHPARVLVLSLQADHSRAMQAWVSVHCRKLGENKQLCAEHIELRFHATAIERTISVIRPLLIGDLPTALWWFTPTPPPLMLQVFENLAGLSQQVIYDSVGWLHPVEGICAMSRWIQKSDMVVYNLAWRRLKSWRRMLATGLDPEFNPGALGGLDTIHIVHGRDALPLAWLLMAWLAARLNWQVKSARYRPHEWIEWTFESQHGNISVRIELDRTGPERTIEKMDLAWLDRNKHRQKIRFKTDGHHLVTDEIHSCIPAISRPQIEFRLEQMVAAQMAHRYSDQLFLRTIKLVADMAKAVHR